MPEYVQRSQRPGIISAARIMLHPLVLSCVLAVAAAAPVTYDQRQDGDFNVRADLQNVVFLIIPPSKIPSDLLDVFLKESKPDQELQERADHVMEAFVEPSTPYKVEIGTSDRSAEGDGRAVEVVIASRRQGSAEEDEWKLLGATEQCGPDRVRDSVTLTCRDKVQPVSDESPQPDNKEPEVQPEVVAAIN